MGSTLATIRGRVRNYLSEATARFWTNAELNQYINAAYQKYTIQIIQTGQDLFKKIGTLDLVSGQAEYNLASLFTDFFLVSQIRRITPYGTIPLRWNEHRYTPVYTTPSFTGQYYTPTCRRIGVNVKLDPQPTFSETGAMYVEYYYMPALLTADGDTYDSNYPTMFEPLIDYDATIAALETKDASGGVSDTGPFKDRRAQLEQLLEDTLVVVEAADDCQYIGVDYQSIF